MIITTIQDVIMGMEIVEYRGLVTGEVVAELMLVKDIQAFWTWWMKSKGIEDEIIQARAEAK